MPFLQDLQKIISSNSGRVVLTSTIGLALITYLYHEKLLQFLKNQSSSSKKSSDTKTSSSTKKNGKSKTIETKPLVVPDSSLTAEELRVEGNQFFKDKDYHNAISFYKAALDKLSVSRSDSEIEKKVDADKNQIQNTGGENLESTAINNDNQEQKETQFLKTDPLPHIMDKAKINNNLAAVHMELKNFSAALLNCKNAINLWPNYQKCWQRIQKILEMDAMKTKLSQNFEIYQVLLLTMACCLKYPTNQKLKVKSDALLSKLATDSADVMFKTRLFGKLPKLTFLLENFRLFEQNFGHCSFYKILTGHDHDIKYFDNLLTDFNNIQKISNSSLSVEKRIVYATLLNFSFQFTSAKKILDSLLQTTENAENMNNLCQEDKIFCTLQLAIATSQLATYNRDLSLLTEAERIYDQAVALDKNSNGEVYYQRAQFNLEQNPEKSLQDFEMCVKLGLKQIQLESGDNTFSPNSSNLYSPEMPLAIVKSLGFINFMNVQLGSLEQDQEIVKEALKNFEILTKKTNSSDIMLLYGQTLESMNRIEEAHELYTKSLELEKIKSENSIFPNIYKPNIKPLIRKIFLLISTGKNIVEAVKLLDQALEIDSTQPDIFEALAMIQLNGKDLNAAISQLEKAIECSRSREEIYNYFCKILSVKAKIDLLKDYGLR